MLYTPFLHKSLQLLIALVFFFYYQVLCIIVYSNFIQAVGFFVVSKCTEKAPRPFLFRNP